MQKAIHVASGMTSWRVYICCQSCQAGGQCRSLYMLRIRRLTFPQCALASCLACKSIDLNPTKPGDCFGKGLDIRLIAGIQAHLLFDVMAVFQPHQLCDSRHHLFDRLKVCLQDLQRKHIAPGCAFVVIRVVTRHVLACTGYNIVIWV